MGGDWTLFDKLLGRALSALADVNDGCTAVFVFDSRRTKAILASETRAVEAGATGELFKTLNAGLKVALGSIALQPTSTPPHPPQTTSLESTWLGRMPVTQLCVGILAWPPSPL